MGLFDDIAGKVSSALGSNTQQAGLVGHVMAFLNSPQSGGLQGVVAAFESNGLGHIVQSWISTGANLPVSPAQIQSALGNGQLQALAAKVGISPDQLSQGLSSVLPHLVDSMTPNGQLPTAAR
jgi:uncharacterized protein YidB (DUF937 family)